MRILRLLLALAVLAALLAGCTAPNATSNLGVPSNPTQAERAEGQFAGTPAQHGAAQRSDGQVTTKQEGSDVVASKTVTIRNDFGGASTSQVQLTTFNGAIALSPSSDGGYLLTAQLYGRGSTEQQARQALDLLVLDATDSLAGGRLSLSFKLSQGSSNPLPMPIGVGPRGVNNGGSFALSLPPQPAIDVQAATDNGAIVSNGLHGPTFKGDTSNGAVAVHGSFDKVTATTTNGAIVADGVVNDLTASTSNGQAAIDVAPSRSGTLDVQTSNGGIDVGVPASGRAYDATGDTTNGHIVIELGGDSVSHRDHAAYRSPDWSSSGIQVTIKAKTTNGGIAIHD